MSEVNNVAEKHIDLKVTGMSCTNCALSIERFLEKEGLNEVYVDFANEEVSFELNSEKELPKIVKGIHSLGFKVVEETPIRKSAWSKVEILFAIALVFTIPLLLHMFLPIPLLHNPYFQLIISIPVFIIGVVHFGMSGWKSLRSGVPNMDVLIIMGASAAFLYSLFGTLTHAGPSFLFYETAASIITIVLLGNVLEHRAVKKTTSSIKALTKLQPIFAKKVLFNQNEEEITEVRLREIEVGDIIQVYAGDQIPVDGIIQQGSAEIDESMLTGESVPLEKSISDRVLGGTYVISGNLRILTEKVGKQTTLSQIIDLVKKAQADKPELQRLADTISAVFVPSVIGISILTFILSFFVFAISLQASIIHSVAVLVISCPCAMGLATPTAVVVGIGRASKNGVLIKGGRTLEALSSIQRVVFDKTGTLTTGNFAVQALHCKDEDREYIQSLIHAMSKSSNHPVSKSLTKAFENTHPLPLTNVMELNGMGIQANDMEGNTFAMGSHKMAKGLTQDLSHQTYVIKNERIIGMLDLKDEIKSDAKEVIDFFKSQGITTTLLSGDRQDKCDQVATSLGIDEIYAEQLPHEKLQLISQFSQREFTAMVGDGINDAPALTQATVGISLSEATQVAIQSAQIILLNGNLSSLTFLYRLGKQTMLTIRQNLFWAFIYNVIAIPVAALGFLSPIIGAFAMAMSDVIVIGNSLRLRMKTL